MRTAQRLIPNDERPAHRRAARGFTLVEVLISIALGAILVNIFTDTLTSTFGLFQRGVSFAEVNRDSRAAINQIIKDLHNATPTDAMTPPARSRHALRGEPGYLEFTQISPTRQNSEARPGGGLQRVAYRLSQASPNSPGVVEKLFLQIPAVIGASGDGDASAENSVPVAKLASDVRRLRFSYFDGAVWRAAWSKITLPRAVRVAVEFSAPREGQRPPVFSTTIALNAYAP